MVRIAFCGTQSVGKTTLVNELKNKMFFKHYTFFTERSQLLNKQGVPLNQASTLNGQMIFAAERARELLKENMVTDRSTIDVAAFTEASPNMNLMDKMQLITILKNMANQYDLIFYLPARLPLVDNGIRDVDLVFRKTIDDYIKYRLSKLATPSKIHKIKSISLGARVKEVMGVIKNGEINK